MTIQYSKFNDKRKRPLCVLSLGHKTEYEHFLQFSNTLSVE